MRMADKRVRGSILAREKAADRRADEVIERIERGGVDPRPLPSLREDSVESIESAESVSGVAGEAEAMGMQEGMPLEGVAPYDPASAEEDLAQRVTEDTDAGGDPHLHNERKADEIARQMTEDTGAGGDMNLHAERKVEQMGNEMFEE
jgi:hypothetical protein